MKRPDPTQTTLLLRPTRAAEIMGVHVSEVYDLIRRGVLPTIALRAGGMRRIPTDALMTWIRTATQQQPAA